jgi:hypothetical protein
MRHYGLRLAFAEGELSSDVFLVLSFDDHAQSPNMDDILDGCADSVCVGSCSGCGAGSALDAIGDGPSLGKADAAATSLAMLALMVTKS